MKAPAVETAFDVAEWFLDTALNEREYLQPAKLQSLMFLAQGFYAAANDGLRLIPAVFVVTQNGPVEPNTYKLYAAGRPMITKSPLPRDVAAFLDRIWRRFGAYSAGYLVKMLSNHTPVAEAALNGERAEISVKSMTLFYKDALAGENTADAMNRPRLMRTQTGRTVCVKKWIPANRHSS